MKTETVHGIEYSRPTVVLLQETGIGTSEIAARTCYDSFKASEHGCIRVSQDYPMTGMVANDNIEEVNSIEHSDLLDTLAWTHFHYSILEHANLTYLIKGTSRAVLQEHARHRIQAISVRSTRYTMSSIINAFLASLADQSINNREWFIDKFISMDILVTTDTEYNKLEASSVYDKFLFQYSRLNNKEKNGLYEFFKIAVSKSSLEYLEDIEYCDEMFNLLESGKKKRNVGDAFKHIVTDNWKVDMVVTFNLRSLKNYFQLRDSGAAYFQIQWLAEEMKKVTPQKYLDLIIKGK